MGLAQECMCIHSLLYIITIKFLYSSIHLVFEFHKDQDCTFFLIWLLLPFFFFLAALSLCCCVWAFSSYGEQQFYSFKAWASHCSGFSCSIWAKLPLGMWNLLGPMIKSMSPTLAGGLLTMGSPGKFRTVSDLSVCLQRVA